MRKRYLLVMILFITSTILLSSCATTTMMKNKDKRSERIAMYTVEKGMKAHNIGYIDVRDTRYGLLFVPKPHGVPKGFHGFHIHAKLGCADHGLAAGGHLDLQGTGKHLGPYDDG